MSLCRLRRAGQFWSAAAARRWSQEIGGGQKFFQRFPKNFILSSKLSDGLFWSAKIENCNKIGIQQQWHRRRADKLSAAAHSSIYTITICRVLCRQKKTQNISLTRTISATVCM